MVIMIVIVVKVKAKWYNGYDLYLKKFFTYLYDASTNYISPYVLYMPISMNIDLKDIGGVLILVCVSWYSKGKIIIGTHLGGACLCLVNSNS